MFICIICDTKIKRKGWLKLVLFLLLSLTMGIILTCLSKLNKRCGNANEAENSRVEVVEFHCWPVQQLPCPRCGGERSESYSEVNS